MAGAVSTKNTITPWLGKNVAYPAAPINTHWPNSYKFILLDDIGELENIIDENLGKPVAFDTETEGLDFERHEIVGFSLSFDGKTGYYVPIRHSRKEWNISDNPREALDLLYHCLTHSQCVFYANRRFDDNMMEYEGFDYDKHCNETECESWGGYNMSKVKGLDVLQFCFYGDSDNFTMLGLKGAAAHFLGVKMMEFEEVSGGAQFQYTDPKESTYYAASDAICTYNLAVVAGVKIFKECKMSGQIDNDFLYPLMKVEREKSLINIPLLSKFQHYIQSELDRIETLLYEIAGYSFNLRSSAQMEKLFLELGIDTGQYTESGKMSTGAKALENLDKEYIDKYPFLREYMKYKRLEKLRSSYIEVLKRVVDSGKDYIRAPYKTTRVSTGRLACGAGKDTKGSEYYTASLNLQNIPKQKSMDYYVFDTKDRGLWYEDLVPETPHIILGGYIMMPVILENTYPVNPKDKRFIEKKVRLFEELEEILDRNFDSAEYVGITESGSPVLNIRSLFLPADPRQNEYYQIIINDKTYYLGTDNNDGVCFNDGTEEGLYISPIELERNYSTYSDMDLLYIISGGEVIEV